MITGAVISATGHKSSFSGFQPMLPVGNTTVIKRIIITLQRVGIKPIVVITGEQGNELEKHIAKMGVICLRHEAYAETSMFESVCMGVNYVEDLCDRVLVMPVRVPMFLAESIEKLLSTKAELACLAYDGQRGHPVLISKEWMPKMMAYGGGRGLAGFLRQEQLEAVIEEIPVDDQGIIFAVETEKDCAGAMELLGHRRLPLHCKTQMYLECEEVFFGPGIAQFLSLIDHTGSMQTACTQMHMSYSKGWKIIKTAEKQLGYPLLVTQAGGVEGGFSQLTPKTKDLLERYLGMEQELKKHAETLFITYFGDERYTR